MRCVMPYDTATRRNLELTETLRGQPAPTLFSLLDTCITSMGSRALRHALSLANMVHLRGRFAVAKLPAQVAAKRRHAAHVALFSFGRHQALP